MKACSKCLHYGDCDDTGNTFNCWEADEEFIGQTEAYADMIRNERITQGA